MPGKGRIGRRRKDSNGYVLICVSHDNHEVREHRMVAAAMLGRALLPSEVVHHKNGRRDDNRPENLEVFASHAEHMAEHMDVERLRAMQRKGAATKFRRTMKQTLPHVLAGVRELIASGAQPTQRACRSIAGYNTIQKYVPQQQLIKMAMESF